MFDTADASLTYHFCRCTGNADADGWCVACGRFKPLPASYSLPRDAEPFTCAECFRAKERCACKR